jgi:hypothetical protein
MGHTRVLLTFVMVLLAGAWLLAGCSDDEDGPTGPSTPDDQDTTPPVIVSFEPAAGETGVPVDAPVTITFNEDMAPEIAPGTVTLFPNEATGLQWLDPRTLRVNHDDWLEGSPVILELAGRLSDVAGNTLAASHEVRFYVQASELRVLETDPGNLWDGIDRGTRIRILFSAPMDLTTLDDALSLVDSDTAPLDYTLSAEGDWVIVDPLDPLPADEEITVSLASGAQDLGGRDLPGGYSFAFTTGQDLDDTPPQILSIEPASGSTLSPERSFLRVTFSESMDAGATTPARINAELFWLVENAGVEPAWSDDHTVFTVALPTPLPAGLPMELEFAGYADASGNVQDGATTWTATVEGTADFYPLVDGARYAYEVHEAHGTIGDPDPQGTATYQSFIQFEAQGGGVFHRTWYDVGYTTPDDWDVLQRSGGALEYLGFRDVDGDQTADIAFDSPLTYVTLPPSGTWADQTTATVPGQGEVTLAGEGEVVGRVDLDWYPGGDGQPAIFWKDVSLVIIEHTITADQTLIEAGVDSLWLAAGYGIVKYANANESPQAGEWEHETGLILSAGD